MKKRRNSCTCTGGAKETQKNDCDDHDDCGDDCDDDDYDDVSCVDTCLFTCLFSFSCDSSSSRRFEVMEACKANL